MLYNLLIYEEQELLEMSPDQIYNFHPVFQKLILENFRSYLSDLKMKASQERHTIKLEERAFLEERAPFPRTKLVIRGYPHWSYHPRREREDL